MLGNRTGVCVKWKKEVNGFMLSIHCAAHKLNLGSGDADKDIPYCKVMNKIITNTYSITARSSERHAQLAAFQQHLGEKELAPRRLHDVRWLSFVGVRQPISFNSFHNTETNPGWVLRGWTQSLGWEVRQAISFSSFHNTQINVGRVLTKGLDPIACYTGYKSDLQLPGQLDESVQDYRGSHSCASSGSLLYLRVSNDGGIFQVSFSHSTCHVTTPQLSTT